MAKNTSNTLKNASKRTRNYATVVYPESAPEGWQNILSEQMIPAFISPLHDKDVNADGKPKKPHFHVMLMFDSVKTEEQAKVVFEKIGGVGCEIVNSIRGYARYLCHLDNPEKAQYSVESVRSMGGATYRNVIGLPSDKYKCIREMIQFINDNSIEAYCDMLEWSSINREDWFQVLCDNGSYVIKEYLKSKTWKQEKLIADEFRKNMTTTRDSD
jgi:hypothetical protein